MLVVCESYPAYVLHARHADEVELGGFKAQHTALCGRVLSRGGGWDTKIPASALRGGVPGSFVCKHCAERLAEVQQ